MFCSNCGKGISNESKFCKFCGSEISNAAQSNPAEEIKKVQAKFNDVGFVLLSIASGGLFAYYNLLRISSLLRKEGYNSPQAIEFFIPFWHIFALYKLFDATKKFQVGNGIEHPITPWSFMIILLFIGGITWVNENAGLFATVILILFIWDYQKKVEKAFSKKYGDNNSIFGKIGVGGYLLSLLVPLILVALFLI